VGIATGSEATWFNTAARLIDLLKSADRASPCICKAAWEGIELGIDDSGVYDCLVLLGSPASWGTLRQQRLIDHVRSGRSLVALAATRAFLPSWPGFATEVLGGCDHTKEDRQPLTVRRAERNWHHSLLDGFTELSIVADVYRGPRLGADTAILLEADAPDCRGNVRPQPVAWLRRHRGGRIFCTTLGRAADFENEGFRQFLVRTIAWVCKQA
jgi:hypothetical protein